MLQKGVAAADLSGAHQLTTIDQDLAAHGSGKTDGRTARRPDGRRQDSTDSQ